MRNLKRRDRIAIIVMILVLILAIAGCVFLTYEKNQYDGAIAGQEDTIRSLENELAVKRAAVTSQANDIVQEVTGLDASRKAVDDLVALEFMQQVTTWSGYEEYDAMRTEVMKKYHLSEDSRFATVFLAPYVITSETAEEYSCRFQDLTTAVSSISGDRYTYFSVVQCLASGPKGGSGKMSVVFMYTVDGDGELSDLNAYAMD